MALTVTLYTAIGSFLSEQRNVYANPFICISTKYNQFFQQASLT